jgi:hypothetical protein
MFLGQERPGAKKGFNRPFRWATACLIPIAAPSGPSATSGYVRNLRPDLFAHPALLGLESFAPVPQNHPANAMRNLPPVKVPKAGHWVHHDQLDLVPERDDGVPGEMRSFHLETRIDSACDR